MNAQGTPDRRKDDEDELEVDVKEDRSEQTGIVTKTYEARWKVLKYEHLPEWLQDNEFLRLKSLFPSHIKLLFSDTVIVPHYHLCPNALRVFGPFTLKLETFGLI